MGERIVLGGLESNGKRLATGGDDLVDFLGKVMGFILIGGDVSESGYFSFKDVAMVPSYDIPSAYIDEDARQFRFSNKTTTDDHAIHIVGTQERADGTWFLIKDSGSGARNGANKGYYSYHEDYIKLKIMYFVVHKSAVKDLLKQMAK